MADATEQPTTASPYEDTDAIKSLVNRKREEWAKGREPFIRAAYRNLLYYRSEQWFVFDRRTNRFRPAILPKGTPTPVTNKFAETVDALISVFGRVEPRLEFAPGSPDEPEDRAAADVAARVIGVIEKEVNIRANRQMLASWKALTPCAWLETGYDPDPAHGTRELDVDACQRCGNIQPPQIPSQAPAMEMAPVPPTCDECGGVMMPTTQTVPVGRMYVDVCSVFEMFYDMAITDWTRQKAYIREKSVSKDEAEARWPHLKDSIEANAVAVNDGWYADALPTLAPNISDSNQGRLLLAQTRQPANRVTERWYWSLPTETYPGGLLAVIVGKEHVGFAGPLPYRARQSDGSSKPFLPHVFFPQKLVPGSGMPKTVADDLALLQARRNKWESIVEASGMRIGSPIWLVPNGCNVPVGSFHGEPAAIVRYNASGAGGTTLKPERVAGQGIPLSFIQRIQAIDKDFESIAGTYDIIKGARPAGVSAGIALQILQERGMSRFAPDFILWGDAWSQWAGQALEIFREYATEERLAKIKGRNGIWEVQKFIGADLQGRVDVIAEAGSEMPRSTLVERAEMEQLFALGILNPMDPETKLEAVKMYGKSYLLPGMANDAKNAIREHEAFEALGQDPIWQQATQDDLNAIRETDYPTIVVMLEAKGIKIPRVRGAVDDHAVHSREHRQYAKSERSESLPEIVQVILEKMIEYHDLLMIQQAQALQGIQKGDARAGYMAPSSPMTSSSSPQRMEGDFDELSADVGAGA